MIFIDTNIPIYAAGQPHPLREACQRVMRAAAAGHIEVVTDSEVFQEILYRYWRIGERKKGLQIFDSFYQIMAGRIFAVGERDVHRARELAEEYSISLRDLIHLAVMKNNDIEEILTADKDFDRVKGIRRIDPTRFRQR